MVFFLSRCTCLPCYRCLRVINFVKIRKPYFAVLGQQSNLNVFNFTISSDCFEVVQTNRMQETVTVNLCSHSIQSNSPLPLSMSRNAGRETLSLSRLCVTERGVRTGLCSLCIPNSFLCRHKSY